MSAKESEKHERRGTEKKGLPQWVEMLIAVFVLLGIWQAAAILVDQALLIPSPASTALRLYELVQDISFWQTILYSLARIALGFCSALLLGILLAALAGCFRFVEIFMKPLMLTVKSVPVASFIIIALIWLSSAKLSAFISFLMVLPVIYNNVLAGIKAADPKLLEMSEIFRLGSGKRLRYIWMPSIEPHLISASETAMGLAWKAGVAAEVIGIPTGSMGEMLYMSKVYLDTDDLLAWTVTIVILSLVLEKLVILLLKLVYSIIKC